MVVAELRFAMRSKKRSSKACCYNPVMPPPPPARLPHTLPPQASPSPSLLRPLPASAHPLVISAVGLRRAVGVCGLALPVLLVPLGWLILGVPPQDNLSSYVHTPLRDVFVGLLFAIGVLLFCYRGPRTRSKNWTANLAAAFALGLALFPLDPGSDPLHQRTAVRPLCTPSAGGGFLPHHDHLLPPALPRTPTSTGVNDIADADANAEADAERGSASKAS